MLTFPAKCVYGDTVPLIQKQRPFLFPLLAYSWQYDHLHKFFTHAIGREYVSAAFPGCRFCMPAPAFFSGVVLLALRRREVVAKSYLSRTVIQL